MALGDHHLSVGLQAIRPYKRHGRCDMQNGRAANGPSALNLRGCQGRPLSPLITLSHEPNEETMPARRRLLSLAPFISAWVYLFRHGARGHWVRSAGLFGRTREG